MSRLLLASYKENKIVARKTKLRDMCAAIDMLDEPFTREDLESLSLGSRSAFTSLLPALCVRNLLTVMQGKPYRYQRIKVGENGESHFKSLTEAFDNGELGGIWSRKHEEEVPTVPVEELLEIEPHEIFDQMDPDDFGRVIGEYLRCKNAEINPLKERIVTLSEEIAASVRDKNALENTLEHKIRGLQEELKKEREVIVELRNEMMVAKERKVYGDTTKIVYARKPDSNPHKESGGTSVTGVNLHSVRVHRRPLPPQHPSRPVIEHVSRKRR